MEKEDSTETLPNIDFKRLLDLAKSGNQHAMYDIIQIFKDDINRASQYIPMSQEDAIQSIITNFLEDLKNTNEKN
ncbi:hypothetical protein D1872_155720 [compost metagenome]